MSSFLTFQTGEYYFIEDAKYQQQLQNTKFTEDEFNKMKQDILKAYNELASRKQQNKDKNLIFRVKKVFESATQDQSIRFIVVDFVGDPDISLIVTDALDEILTVYQPPFILLVCISTSFHSSLICD